MSQTIEILIAQDGSSRVETKGYSGNTGPGASRFLEQALGQPAQKALKPEFYQTIAAAEPIRQQV